jgi:nickel transport protein
MVTLRLFFFCFLLLAASTVLAHGGHGQASVQPAITVTFTGHDGNPQADLTSRVFGPDGSRYLAGQTDALGRIVFLPDRAGEWTVKAMSEDGHGGTVKVMVGEDLRLVGSSDAHDHDHDAGFQPAVEPPHEHDHAHDTGHDHDHAHPGEDGHTHTHEAAPAEGGMSFAAALGYLLGAFGVVALILSRKRPSA